MKLSLHRTLGKVFEGSSFDVKELIPRPVIFPCITCRYKEDIPKNISELNLIESQFMFRQEYFDSKSRIRTGYLYKRNGNQPAENNSEKVNYGADGYSPLSIWAEHLQQNRKMFLALGDANRFTVWKLVDIEVVFTGAELITLKALSTFGVLPDLLEAEIPEDCLSTIKTSLDKLVNEVYTASAESVVDHCREAATAILSTKLNESGKDLGKLISQIEAQEGNNSRSLIVSTPAIINRLHTRRKTSEAQSRSTRPVVDEDAQLAISCLGTILVELGYAKW